jgi:UDP-N-acetylmuramoylalanine-D-glutamate ligase
LVLAVKDRLRGVVLLGQDRRLIADALARHAPDVPTITVTATDTGAMDSVVGEASALAKPGDTVLLAPGCASWTCSPTTELVGTPSPQRCAGWVPATFPPDGVSA